MAVGALRASQLTEVEPGIFLGTTAARAYRRAKAAFRAKGKTLKAVGKYAAYRSAFIQNDMRDAGLNGPASKRAKYELNPNSKVSIASHPNGTHEDGKAVDILINGSSAYPNATDRALLKKYGWTFTFGPNDPNHMHHNGITAILPVTRAWCIKNGLFVQPKK